MPQKRWTDRAKYGVWLSGAPWPAQALLAAAAQPKWGWQMTDCNSNDSKYMSTVPPPPPDNGGQICWVAREVYGENDGRWLEFRSWLLGEAPGWLRKTYVKHGAAFATWVSDKPLIKKGLRRMMDRAIRR